MFTFGLLNASSVHIIEGNMSTWIIKYIHTHVHTNTHTFGEKVHIFTSMIMTIVIIIVTFSFFTKIRFPRKIKAEIHNTTCNHHHHTFKLLQGWLFFFPFILRVLFFTGNWRNLVSYQFVSYMHRSMYSDYNRTCIHG